ncbi:ADM_collapsed_G0029640.mRNA.1.CDS.1 [Saccharomyces cerevisiae]|nr:ADM_collapsed_G0029640.mRNA.1.CDS.1 [Saccharomyces cerevisiae]
MLAFSAAAPAFKGWLADQDVRWNVISGAVDDRTPKERGVAPLLPKYNKNGFGGIAKDVQDKVLEIPKSRYSSVDLFLVLGRLLENDKAPLDYDLAKHFAHLYIRDPVSTFEELLNQDNKTSSNHFENIQSTNWQTLRFKPPTQQATPDKKDSPGWRVEFRPFEVQLLDFENAAYSVLIYLIVDSILTFSDNINAYIHMS